jgi:ribosome biogenesis GTPase
MPDVDLIGLIVTRHRRTVTVEDEQRNCHLAVLKGRQLNPVVGDQVGWSMTSDGSARVNSVKPRTSEIVRLTRQGTGEVVAANVTQLVVVIANQPTPAPALVDRYLGAAAVQGIQALIVANKIDLEPVDPTLLTEYAGLGYDYVQASAITQAGIDQLGERLGGHTSVMLGQSGVGKSSLTNALIGKAEQSTKTLSEKSGQGRHTTSAARLFHLPHGGRLIDSPGVRDYAPYLKDLRQVQQAFIEIEAAARDCRFNDCQHRVEPGCAVLEGLAAGSISQRRYESFRSLAERHTQLQS